MKKVSVILTTYNSEKYIQRTIDSVFNQKGINEDFTIELIVVDDCSKDNTTSILRNNNIDFLSTGSNSGGPNKGRNIGLKKASGDFICIMDHDDEWAANKTITQLKFCDMAPVITCGFTVKNAETKKESFYINKPENQQDFIFYAANKTFLQLLSKEKKGQLTYMGGIMLDKSLKNILFEETYGMIDYDWGLRLFNNNASVEVCASLFNRHILENNLSLNNTYRIKDYNYSLETLELYKDNYPREVAMGAKRINGTMARYCYFVGEMKDARRYLKKSSFNLVNLLYYLTSFYGHRIVKRKFRAFG